MLIDSILFRMKVLIMSEFKDVLFDDFRNIKSKLVLNVINKSISEFEIDID